MTTEQCAAWLRGNHARLNKSQLARETGIDKTTLHHIATGTPNASGYTIKLRADKLPKLVAFIEDLRTIPVAEPGSAQ